MSFKNLVTQGELKPTIAGLNALADNLDEHVNQSLSKAHGWSILTAGYLDTGGNYQTDFSGGGLVPIPGLFNTGVNNDGTLATPGSVDQHWKMVQSASHPFPGPDAPILTPLPANYASNGPNSQYIGARVSGNVASGTYKFRISFDLTGLNPASAVITGVWSSDNQTTSVLLNGIATGYKITSTTSFTAKPSAQFQLNGPFLAGVNTLDFVVSNGSSSSRVSVRVEVSGKAAVGGVSGIPGLFATGVNSGGVVVPNGSNEAHWTLVESADPSNPGPTPFVMTQLGGGYAPNTSASKWIGPRKQGNVPPGTYVYRITFDLTGFNAATAIVKGRFWSNDRTHDAKLNGVSIGLFNTNAGKTYPTVFVITTGFLTGVNTLDFVVVNDNNQDSGFRAEISGTASNAGDALPSRVLRLTVGSNIFYFPCQLSGGLDGEPDPTIPVFTGIVSPQSADPASDLTTGSPTPIELVTTFSELLSAVSNSATNTLLEHAGSPAEHVHSGLSFQNDSVTTSGGYVVGRRTVNITINGVQYKLVGDFKVNGPIGS